jgi:hypothetical protein
MSYDHRCFKKEQYNLNLIDWEFDLDDGVEAEPDVIMLSQEKSPITIPTNIHGTEAVALTTPPVPKSYFEEQGDLTKA